MIQETKNELRKRIRTLFKAQNRATLDALSEQVLGQLESCEQFQTSEVVAMYWSMDDEVSTHNFIEKWSERKQILLPIVCGDDMVFCPYSKVGDLSEGSFSILEPKMGEDFSESIDLMIVPAMAYDSSGARLGRGKGFYDRFLDKHESIKTLGLCFGYQLLPFVPCQKHDKKVDQVLWSR